MDQTEKQNYIRLQTMKLQKLSDIIYYSNQLLIQYVTNIRVVSDYNTKDDAENISTRDLFGVIDDYKTLLTDFGELK